MNSSGTPNLQTHRLISAEATVPASLFGTATNSTYFVKASVMQRRYFFSPLEVFKGPNKSAWILWFGSVHWGRGVSSCGGFLFGFVNWHLWHFCKWSEMSLSMFGQKYESRIFSFVFKTPKWPLSSCPWASLMILFFRCGGVSNTGRKLCCLSSRFQTTPSWTKQSSADLVTKRARFSFCGKALFNKNRRRALRNSSLSCYKANDVKSRPIASTALRERKSAGISEPFL